eukprot:TRINITY_DN2563_c0_g1_i5.p1 TRINITY_DN2563_c0_g1~~TRINITY_DN2563_c0_g1_i5.p1  ORF type:complete len:171 (-),score=25.03 TRINITY_DN2563_c0_g1_i5:50-562(-)
MSSHIASLKPGDTLEIKGPIKKLPYKANMKDEIGMIAGGSGITPMLQVLQEILRNPDDQTEVSLIFANVTEEDILLRRELEQLTKDYPNFKLYYILSRPSENWTQSKGYVSKEMIISQLPPPSPKTLIYVCGPNGMVNYLSGAKNPDNSQGPIGGLLKDLGYTEDMVYKF